MTPKPSKPADEIADSGEQPLEALQAKIAEIEARLAHLPLPPPARAYSAAKLAIIATSIYKARRRRTKYFASELFAEPAWDMLLELFINRALGRRVTVTSLCVAGAVPQATGLRYVAELERAGLVERFKAPDDRRVTVLQLTTFGFRQMRNYVIEGIARFDMPATE